MSVLLVFGLSNFMYELIESLFNHFGEIISNWPCSGFGLRVSGFGFRASGFGFRASGFGFRASLLHLKTFADGLQNDLCGAGNGLFK